MDEFDRVGVFMLADPALGITLDQAKNTLDAVLEFNRQIGVPGKLGRAGMTGQLSTTTKWTCLLDYVHYAAVEKNQGDAVRIYGDLQGMSSQLAEEIKKMGAWLFSEWFAPSLDTAGVEIMVQQGVAKEEAEAMLAGILNALTAKSLTGIEFQVNRWNIQYLEDFIKMCLQLGVEPHLEMQEMQFNRGDDLIELRQKYLKSLPTKAELQRAAEMVSNLTGQRFEELLSPFFCSGNTGMQFGMCNYWFENGVFIWPNGHGGLLRTACLSDKTVIDSDFEPTVLRLKQHLAHPLIKMRKNLKQENMAGTKCFSCRSWQESGCRGGCRAMAFLATCSDFSPDPNCWQY